MSKLEPQAGGGWTATFVVDGRNHVEDFDRVVLATGVSRPRHLAHRSTWGNLESLGFCKTRQYRCITLHPSPSHQFSTRSYPRSPLLPNRLLSRAIERLFSSLVEVKAGWIWLPCLRITVEKSSGPIEVRSNGSHLPPHPAFSEPGEPPIFSRTINTDTKPNGHYHGAQAISRQLGHVVLPSHLSRRKMDQQLLDDDARRLVFPLQ